MREGKGGRGAGGQSYGGSAPPLQHPCPHIDPGHKLRRGSLRMQVEPQWAGGSAMCLACWSLRPHVASSGSRRQSLLGGRPQQPWNSPLNLGPSRSGKSNRAKLHRWATRCLKVALCATNRSACVGHSPSPSWKPSSLRAGRLAPATEGLSGTAATTGALDRPPGILHLPWYQGSRRTGRGAGVRLLTFALPISLHNSRPGLS